MFNYIDIYIVIPVSGCLGRGPVHCFSTPAKEVSVFPVDDKTEITQINDIKIKNATVLDTFHDVVIHAIGYTINFEFDVDTHTSGILMMPSAHQLQFGVSWFA
jgi:hypothetical protein